MKSDLVRLQHIRDAVAKIKAFAAGSVKDEKTEAAIMYEITVIGEAVRAISHELKSAHSQVPWQDIIGMRNKLVHEYFQTDKKVLWDTVDEDIPQLQKWVDDLVKKLQHK